MQFVWNDLIDRARVYIDDDHKETDGWISPTNWLTLFNVEYAQLFRKWVRAGLIAPAYTETPFSGSSTSLSGVLAIVGVAQDMGSYRRPVFPAQSVYGRAPFWGGTMDSGPSMSWAASGTGDNLTLTLDPPDSATSNYLVRWIAAPAYATDATTTVELPYGGDERLVLGAARRALVKDSTASQSINALIADADADLNFLAFGRANGDSPRVRRVTPLAKARTWQLGSFPSDPRFWTYL